jgi:DNA-binding MarR family transcriptional regulator
MTAIVNREARDDPPSPAAGETSGAEAGLRGPLIGYARLARISLQRWERKVAGPTGGDEEFEILSSVASHRSDRQGALAHALLLSNSALSRRLAGLEARGLVRRSRRDADRRSVRVEVTEAGLSLLDEVRQTLREEESLTLATLDSEELEALRSALESVASLIGKAEPTPSPRVGAA